MQSRLAKMLLIGVCLLMLIGVNSPQPSIGQTVSVDVIKIEQTAKIIGMASVSEDTNEVVYVCQGKDKTYYSDIWVYDADTKQNAQITDGQVDIRSAPKMNSKFIVWPERNYDGNGKLLTRQPHIVVYNRETKEKKTISKTNYFEANPLLSDHYVVWSQTWNWFKPNTLHHGLWGYDILKDKTFEIKPFDVPLVGGHSIDGSRFVWSDNSSGDYDIYMFDMETGAKKTICNAKKDQTFPSIDGDYTIWQDERNQSKSPSDNSDIYGYKLSDDSEFIVDDDIDSTLKCPTVKNGKIAFISILLNTEPSNAELSNSQSSNAVVLDLNNDKQQIHKSDILKGGIFNSPRLSDEFVIYVDTNSSSVSGYSFARGEKFDVAPVSSSPFWLNISRNILAWANIPKDEALPRDIFVAKINQ